MNRRLVVLSICMAAALAVSCGDDEHGPSGPGTAPEASTLSAVSGSTDAIYLTWTSCGSSDFTEYRIYRSLTTGIQANPDQATIIQIVTSSSDTTLTDSGLGWNTTYYYAVRTMDSEGLSAWSNEASATTPDSGGGGDALTCYEIQGQQASSPYLGQTVSVTGVVTAGADDYTAASGSTYAAITDADGGSWSGLLLYGSGLAGLERGDSVTVTGVVDEYYEMTELKYPISYVVHSTGHSLPEPEDFTSGELSPVLDLEQWEAVFVRVSDVVVTQTGMPHYTWAVDDGSGECYAGTMGDFAYTPFAGNSIVEMTGLLWYSYDFKIQPRDDADIVR